MTTLFRMFGLGIALCFALDAQAITLSFANLTGSQVVFTGTGDSFTFTPSTPADQFRITLGGTGAAVGLKGNLSSTFTIGAITTIGAMQSAPVLGTGVLRIHDGVGNDLTALLTWDTVSTFGTGGIINVNGLLNLSTISYSGPNVDLLAFAAPGVGTEVLSFQFIPGKSLTQLTANGAVNKTSYSGTLNAEPPAESTPDGGSGFVLLGMALLGLSLFRSKLSLGWFRKS